MPREKEGYRDQLERLSTRFPGRETIYIKEACEVIGLSRETLLLDKTFPAKKPGDKKDGRIVIPLVALARWMS